MERAAGDDKETNLVYYEGISLSLCVSVLSGARKELFSSLRSITEEKEEKHTEHDVVSTS